MTEAAILCCGEAVMDHLPAGLADGTSGLRPRPGGAAVNSAVGIARLGAASGFCGAISRDEAGQALADHLRAAGVSLAQVDWREEPSTIALAYPQPEGMRFRLYAQGSCGPLFEMPPCDEISEKALLFGGISLIEAPAADRFETLMRRWGAGRLVMLDLNIRPGLVRDRGAYLARLERMMALAQVIKVSDEDLAYLELSAQELHFRHPEAVLLQTRGSAGAVLWRGGTAEARPAPACSVVDTLGAGDVFNAGFLAYLARAEALGSVLPATPVLLAAMAQGIRAAAWSVTQHGAAAPTLEDLNCER